MEPPSDIDQKLGHIDWENPPHEFESILVDTGVIREAYEQYVQYVQKPYWLPGQMMTKFRFILKRGCRFDWLLGLGIRISDPESGPKEVFIVVDP
jgi:hypothetical protein